MNQPRLKTGLFFNIRVTLTAQTGTPAKRIYLLAMAAAVIAIAAKLTYFFAFVPNEEFDLYVRFFYLLALLLALFFSVHGYKSRHRESSFADDVKTGMKSTSVFALIVSAFTWIYYKLINPGFFAERIERAVAATQSGDAGQVENVRKTAEFIFNPFTHSTITLFGLMVLGLFYTLILVLIFRSKAGAQMLRR